MSHMYRCRHNALAIAIGIFLYSADSIQAETWSDASGKFKIEAQYGGVDGKNLVLKKADGSTISVPISRLSPASRAQAKKLFEQSRSGASAASASPVATAPISSAQPMISSAPVEVAPPDNINFTPPTPSPVDPLPAFPENASLQETVDFIEAQVMAGHPEVFWHALPQKLRDAIDSPDLRTELAVSIQEQKKMSTGMEQALLKACEVLIGKKEFLLNSQFMTQIPPNFPPMIKEAYDPAAGLIYELVAMSINTENLGTIAMSDWVNAHGPRIGGHAKKLLTMAPPGSLERFQVTVQENGDSGSITSQQPGGETKTSEMLRYEGRWVPAEIATKLNELEGDLGSELAKFFREAREKNEQANPEQMKQVQMMSGMMIGMADGVLNPLLAASTQEEFDQALMKLAGIAAMMGGGGGPGGPPPGF